MHKRDLWLINEVRPSRSLIAWKCKVYPPICFAKWHISRYREQCIQWCYELNVCGLLPCEFVCWSPKAHRDGLWSGAFGRWSGPEGRAFMMGLVLFQEETGRDDLSPPWEDTSRVWLATTHKRLSPKPSHVGTWSWSSSWQECEKIMHAG